MKKVFNGILLFLTIICSTHYAQQSEVVNRHKFDPQSDPFVDVKAAVEDATKNNKRIILDVGGEWCIWCHRLDKFIGESEEIKNILNEYFVLVKVNYSPENKNEKFLSQFPKVPGYPHFFVLEKDGTLLHSQDTGKLEKDKSYSEELLLAFLKEWAPKK